MPPMFRTFHAGDRSLGGILGYPLDRVRQEVAELSIRVHWTYESIMNLDHAERRQWIETLASLAGQ